MQKTGAGSDFLGWVDLPVNYDKTELERIKKAAKKIITNSDVITSNRYRRLLCWS